MDKLSLTLLFAVLLTGYTSLLLLILSMLMILGVLDITHLTLFFMTLLGVYNLYGTQGLCVLLLSTLSFMGSGYMYITDVSITDMIKTVTNTEINHGTLLTTVFYKTGISKESIQYIYNCYNSIALKYNIFCEFVYIYLCKLRYITENITGFKYLYDLYDRWVLINQDIAQYHKLFTISPELPHPHNIVSLSNVPNNIESEQNKNSINISDIYNDELDIDEHDEIKKNSNNIVIEECVSSSPKKQSTVNNSFGSLFCNNNNLDFSNIMKINTQMEKQLSNMAPEHKQQLDKMALNMMGSLFGNIKSKTN
jgi:hypothetical protein